MLTLSEAAEATGKHKSTIQRALNAGKIPSTRDVHGNYEIDPDALHAVYPKVEAPLRNEGATVANATESYDAPLHDDAQHRAIAAVEAARIEDLQATISDLQRRLDEAAETESKHLQLLAMKEQTLQITDSNADTRLAELKAERDAWKEQAQDWKTQASNQTLLLSQAQDRKRWFGLFG